MTTAKPISFTLSAPGAVISALRGLFAPTASDDLPSAPPLRQQDVVDPLAQDRARYARLLEKELDRQLLTEVEQEDSDMLNRVRAALYAE